MNETMLDIEATVTPKQKMRCPPTQYGTDYKYMDFDDLAVVVVFLCYQKEELTVDEKTLKDVHQSFRVKRIVCMLEETGVPNVCVNATFKQDNIFQDVSHPPICK